MGVLAIPLSLAVLAGFASAISLTVSTTGGNASSPILYGFMFEDINHSGDGGLHGQLLQNDGFQGPTPNLTAWAAVGDVTLAVDSDHPLSALANSLRVDVPSGTTGQVGFSNEGYWGIPVTDDTMTSYGFIEGDFSGNLTAQVVAADGTVLGQSTFAIESNSSAFTPWTTSFTTTAAADAENLFTVTFDGASVAGSSLYFNLVQLFPTTFKNRYNGLKPWLANALVDVGGSFLRFPGGNNLEGNSVDTRWKWNETIGPLEDRPGHMGTWTYPNTDALGLLEYLLWCEDMDLAIVMAVWDGLTIGGGCITDSTELEPYVQTAIDQIEYVMGDTSTTYGALRAAHGHPDPFTITAIEIGNEDFLNDGVGSYAARFTQFYDGLSAVYPDLTYIASTDQGLPDPMPNGTWMDIHYYLSPDEFVDMFDLYDNWNRSNKLFIGEYAVTSSNAGDDLAYPTLIGAVGEAVFMIGMERNSGDLIAMASYAPLLQHLNSTQWTPDLISYTSNPADLTLSASYYVQKMFASNRGSTILPVTSDTGFGPVYWVASVADDGTYFVKIANYGNATESLTFTVPDATSGTVTTLTGPSEDSFNSPGSAVVVPATSDVTGSDGAFTIELPAWSVVVAAVS